MAASGAATRCGRTAFFKGDTMRIRLTHSSNAPGAEGEPGDVIECDDAIAQQFIDGRGAVRLDGQSSDSNANASTGYIDETGNVQEYTSTKRPKKRRTVKNADDV